MEQSSQMKYPQNLTESERYWYDLIQQCRASGKSDYQWLKDNNIKSPTFYYHVKKLREKSCPLPESTKRSSFSEVQEVVPVFFQKPEPSPSFDRQEPMVSQTSETNSTAIRIRWNGVYIEILNEASQKVIQTTLSVLKDLC